MKGSQGIAGGVEPDVPRNPNLSWPGLAAVVEVAVVVVVGVTISATR